MQLGARGKCSSCTCEHITETETCFGALMRTLKATQRHLERASAGWVKEIEAHRMTTHKLIKAQQNPHASH